MFKSVYTTILLNIQKSLGKGSDRIIDLVIDRNISISRYNPLAGTSCIKLSRELDHPRNRLILTNIQNTDDNECCQWCLVTYLNPENHRPVRVTKADKDF